MIPNIPDFYEAAYGAVWFFAGRYYAGGAYRDTQDDLERYNKLTPRQQKFEVAPSPAFEAGGIFLLFGLWPIIAFGATFVSLKNANAGKLHAAKKAFLATIKFTFVGRAPRKERRKLELQQRDDRIKQLEEELELNA